MTISQMIAYLERQIVEAKQLNNSNRHPSLVAHIGRLEDQITHLRFIS